MLSGAGVAPLPRGFHKLLSDTVTTLAVFTSWMYLLGWRRQLHVVRAI